MRSSFDRLRHALSFELIGLLLIIPLGAILFGVPVHDIGIIGIVSSIAATIWNMVFNWLFDLAMMRTSGTTLKTAWQRALHAVLFELGLLSILMPFIALYMGISLLEALAMDLVFAGFYAVYAFGFNWAYDRLFPLPEWSAHTGTGA